jgi:hypothetical protein
MDMVREAEKELGRGVEEKLELNRFDRAFHSLLCRHRHMHNQTDLLTDEWMNRWMDGWRDGWRDLSICPLGPSFFRGKNVSPFENEMCV